MFAVLNSGLKLWNDQLYKQHSFGRVQKKNHMLLKYMNFLFERNSRITQKFMILIEDTFFSQKSRMQDEKNLQNYNTINFIPWWSLLVIYYSLSKWNFKVTSVSKKSGHTTVVIQYCSLSSFFLKQTLYAVTQ